MCFGRRLNCRELAIEVAYNSNCCVCCHKILVVLRKPHNMIFLSSYV